MKFCENCGKEIGNLDKHCSHCGKKVNNESVPVKKSSNMDGLGTASMVIGIISLVFSFIINIFIFPVAVIGLILGIISKAHKGKRISGIVLNIIAIVFSILVFIFWICLINYVVDKDYSHDNHIETIHDSDSVLSFDYAGTWNCKSILSNDNEIKLEINDDGTFILSDIKNTGNFIKGTYENSDNRFGSYFGKNNYHAIELDANSRYENDVYKSIDDSEYGMIIAKGKDKSNAILAADDSEKIYYCNME